MELNEKEKKVLKAFPVDEPTTLAELAKAAFPSMGNRPTTKGNSWVRNSLRKLLRLKMAKQMGRGLYRRTVTAKKATPSKSAKKTTAKVSATPKNGHRKMTTKPNTTVVGSVNGAVRAAAEMESAVG